MVALSLVSLLLVWLVCVAVGDVGGVGVTVGGVGGGVVACVLLCGCVVVLV